jgi:hypothetical protein
MPQSFVHHYFVTSNATDPEVASELGGLDPNVDAPTSITRFLTLPIVRRQRHTKIRDPIFNFAQSKILTSNEYTIVAEDMKLAKAMAEIEKEQQRRDKQNLRRRKEREREEERSAKVAAREEAAYLQELRAAEQAELQARCQAVREEAQRMKVQRLADVASTKAAKAAERARKASECEAQQRLRAARAAEMAQGSQGGGRSVDGSPTDPQVLPTHISSSTIEDFHHFPAAENIPYFFSPFTFFPMSSSAHLSFQQLNSLMQSLQPSHPMLQFTSPFQVFQSPVNQTPQWGNGMHGRRAPRAPQDHSGR